MNDSTVLITGATSGIGLACAHAFAQAGFDLVLWARRENRLLDITKQLEDRYRIRVFTQCIDVRNRDAVSELVLQLENEGRSIDIVINNAGLSRGLSAFHEGDFEDWDEMIDTNVKGLLNVTRFVVPGMVHRARGTVINIASIAGRQAYPGGNVYGATKAAVQQLTRNLHIDLNGTGVRVCNVDPGLVETEFSEVRFRGNTERAQKVYEGYTPLTAEDIAEIVLFVATRKPHVNIQDVLVTPSDQATAMIVHKDKPQELP